jgi:hypothetical protein
MTIDDDLRNAALLLPALESGDLETALATGKIIETPRKIGNDSLFPAADLEHLKRIHSASPKILRPIGPEKLRTLQIVAAVAYLVGISRYRHLLPEAFNTGLKMDNEAAVRMVHFSARHRSKMEYFRAANFKRVRHWSSPNSDEKRKACPTCDALRGREWKLNQAPELPYELCTSRLGCRLFHSRREGNDRRNVGRVSGWMRIPVGPADFHREAMTFSLDRPPERTYTSLVSPQSFRRASRRQFGFVGSHDPEKFQAVLLELNRFTALDTPRTLRISLNLTPQEAQPCIHTCAVDARNARPKFCWKTGKIRIRIYSTEFQGRVQGARLVPIAGRYSCPRLIT